MGAENEAVEAPPYSALLVEVVRMPGGYAEPDQVPVEELALGFCLSEGSTSKRSYSIRCA